MSEDIIKELFEARCEDLKLQNQHQANPQILDNFRVTCLAAVKGRKLKLTNLGLGR